VNLGIMGIFARRGIGFAFPAQTLYVNQVERAGRQPAAPTADRVRRQCPGRHRQ